MMHSSPNHLLTALDIVKRLRHELIGHLTPEQQREITRVEYLISEAQKNHNAALLASAREAKKAHSSRSNRSRGLRGRISSLLRLSQ